MMVYSPICYSRENVNLAIRTLCHSRENGNLTFPFNVFPAKAGIQGGGGRVLQTLSNKCGHRGRSNIDP